MRDFQPGWNTTVLPKEPSAANVISFDEDDGLPF
jgi:hypothetical protein